MQFDDIAEEIKRYHPQPDLALLKKSYNFASRIHRDQKRASGEPYLNHLLETALLVCRLKLDVPSVAAALLHDTIEDTDVTREDLAGEFSPEIADIVEGVTKLTRIESEWREVKQAESFRKMLLAMAKDIRVILVKLCDRLHNMRTLNFLSEARQTAISRETLDIYAPLANRLGIQWLKSELQDLCLMYLRPEMYKLIANGINRTAKDREEYIAKTTGIIVEKLESAGISGSVKGRAKSYYSISQKMEKNNLSFDEVHDILGFRIIVPTIRACYETLGTMHASWKPVPNMFKDYIAMPKPNMYQSLHTTVIGPQGRRMELQIRTPEMNKIAEEGIAAHWKYKEGIYRPDEGFDLKWVRDLVETQQYLKNPDEFIQSVKGELFPEEVFVFTPNGDLIRLPYGSTPVDFAYSVHTDVGHQATGAKCNGKMVPLSYRLQNGDTVEIITSKTHVPNKDWLEFLKTSRAKQKVRSFLKSQEREQSRTIGHEVLTKDLKKVKLSLKKLEKSGELKQAADQLGFSSIEDMYSDIGYGKMDSAKVVKLFMPDEEEVEAKLKKKSSPLEKIFEKAARASRQKVGVKVSGFDDILIRFAKCCEPLPGDRVVGFITRGRGVAVHLANCAQVLKSDPLRLIEVTWDSGIKTPRRVCITVHCQDQIGLLANVSAAITAKGLNIGSLHVQTTSFGKAVITIELMVEEAKQLQELIRAIEKVKGVSRVERVKHLVASVNVHEGEER